MTPLGEFDFVWTFPTFLLARNFVTDSATGNIMFNYDLQFIAPAVAATGEQGIAMFTDRHLAEEYLELIGPELGMRLLEISGPHQLGYFIRNVSKKYRYVAVDPNCKTGVIRSLLIEDVLKCIDEADEPTKGE